MDSYYHNGDDQTYLPPCFRFHPTDEELILYLWNKVMDTSFTARAIAEVHINKSEPWELPGKAKMGEKEWYFFSLRDRKYPTGLYTNRATEAGHWKDFSKDRKIYSSKTCALIGRKKTLVYYRGRAPKGEKSNWVMHEYRLEGNFSYHYLSRSSEDEWVISRVFQKSGTGNGSGGARKTNMSSAYPEPSSPSSVSLPPFFDHTTYSAAATDCSYGSHNQTEHMSYLPTVSATANAILPAVYQGEFDLSVPPPPPPQMMNNSSFDSIARYTRNGGVPVFPSLSSLEENVQLPFFFSQPALAAAAPPLHGGSSLNWGTVSEEGSAGPTEFDCMMWTY